MSEHPPDRALPPARHDAQDLDLRSLAKLLALIGVTLVLMLLIARWIFPNAPLDGRFAQPFPDFPAPKLQADTPADMRAFHADQMAELNGTGWRDRQAGTVHIPIEQAMRAIARDGARGWPAGPLNGALP